MSRFIAALGLFFAANLLLTQPVSPAKDRNGLYLETISPTVGGGKIHGQQFVDPEDIVSKGSITSIEVHYDDYIRAIRLTYGQDGIGDLHGFPYGKKTEWRLKDGERIVRVEGECGNYLTKLQFFTDGGDRSPVFGGKKGSPFAVSDSSGGALRTISGWANLKRHESLQRAIDRLTLHFGAPYYIKEIKYDLAPLEAAKLKAAPYQVARMELPNRSSVEQQVVYKQKKTVTTEKTLTFEQSFGLKFGQKISASLTAGLGKIAEAKVESEFNWEFSSNTKLGQSYTNSQSQEVSWSIPVKVPAHSKVIAISTMRQYKAKIPFTYTIAWYEGSRENIKKELKLPGVYEGTHIEDLQHEFSEEPLK
jgi:hypothetical protein